MHFYQSFIILLTITTSLILIPDRVNRAKAERKVVGCKGIDLTKNVTYRANIYVQILHNISNLFIPVKFDAREKWPNCRSLFYIKDQGACGGCWAFASASVIEDRICIGTGLDTSRSEQDLLECCLLCPPPGDDLKGCKGGLVFRAFEYWYKHGLVTGGGGCKPIDKKVLQGIPPETCRKKCTNRTFPVNYNQDKIFPSVILVENVARSVNIKHIMAEIMLNGPVVASMDSYQYMSFPELQQGVLKYDSSLMLPDEKPVRHAIKIIGWDEIDGIPVWIIANSWGPSWCNQGFCYVKRADLGIEDRYILTGIVEANKKQKETEKQTIDFKESKERTTKNKTETSGSNVIEITNIIKAVLLCTYVF